MTTLPAHHGQHHLDYRFSTYYRNCKDVDPLAQPQLTLPSSTIRWIISNDSYYCSTPKCDLDRSVSINTIHQHSSAHALDPNSNTHTNSQFLLLRPPHCPPQAYLPIPLRLSRHHNFRPHQTLRHNNNNTTHSPSVRTYRIPSTTPSTMLRLGKRATCKTFMSWKKTWTVSSV